MTAGYLPLGATIATERLFEAFLGDDHAKTFFHGHSFTANPLACAVALASLDLFRETDVLGRIARLEARMRAALAPLAALPIVGDVRVIGGVGIVELVSDKTDATDRRLSRRHRSAPRRRVSRTRPPASPARQHRLLHAAVRDHGRGSGLGHRSDQQRCSS